MSDINITISGKKRLLTAGKYCDKNIVINPVGGGDFSGEYVIPVDELPTENIDTNALYLCDGAYYKGSATKLVDVGYGGKTENGIVVQSIKAAGYYYVKTKPTENISVSVYGGDIYAYYVEGDNNVFVYGDMSGTGNNSWITISQVVGLPFYGVVDANNAWNADYSTQSVYAYVDQSGWTKYLAPTGTLEITESGTYDVSEYASAEVNVAVPMEVETEAEMTALLETAEIGSVYKYIGASGTYETDALYVVEESE